VEAAPHLRALKELRIQYWDGPPEVLEAFLVRLPALETLSLVCTRVTQLPASCEASGVRFSGFRSSTAHCLVKRGAPSAERKVWLLCGPGTA